VEIFLIEDPREIDLVRKLTKTGRPLGNEKFLDNLEKISNRVFRIKKSGRARIVINWYVVPRFNSKNKDLENQLAKVRADKEIYQGADSNFKTTIITAFQLANKASELFESSKTSEKRELINFVFSNLSMNGDKLVFIMRKPFDMFLKTNDRLEWLWEGLTL
jgi:hypothetical protein